MPRMLFALALALLWPASIGHADLLEEASLRGGDYGAGVAVDTKPDATACISEGGSPGVLGIATSADGASFTGTETDGRSNALLNWALGSDAASFRSAGTVTSSTGPIGNVNPSAKARAISVVCCNARVTWKRSCSGWSACTLRLPREVTA